MRTWGQLVGPYQLLLLTLTLHKRGAVSYGQGHAAFTSNSNIEDWNHKYDSYQALLQHLHADHFKFR